MTSNRIYVAIDLKSFYASVECKERNLDPLTTNLVVAWYQFILQQYGAGSYQARNAWVIYKVILPAVKKDILLSTITEDYINDILKECNRYSDSAATCTRKVILLALSDAEKEGIIRPMNRKFINVYKENSPKAILYTKDQIRILLEETKRYHSIYLEVLLAIFCGLRTGKILGLKAEDFDMEAHTVTIRRQITRDYQVDVFNGKKYVKLISQKSVKPPKSFNSYRTLRIHQVIIDELIEEKAVVYDAVEEIEEFIKEISEQTTSEPKESIVEINAIANQFLL